MRACLAAAAVVECFVTGLLAWWRGQPGQVGNEAATVVICQCRGSGSSPPRFCSTSFCSEPLGFFLRFPFCCDGLAWVFCNHLPWLSFGCDHRFAARKIGRRVSSGSCWFPIDSRWLIPRCHSATPLYGLRRIASSSHPVVRAGVTDTILQ